MINCVRKFVSQFDAGLLKLLLVKYSQSDIQARRFCGFTIPHHPSPKKKIKSRAQFHEAVQQKILLGKFLC